jgi:hypothetical protein
VTGESGARLQHGSGWRRGTPPEQLWHHLDRPENAMHVERPAGWVMPLMWTDAECAEVLLCMAPGLALDLVLVVSEAHPDGLAGRGWLHSCPGPPTDLSPCMAMLAEPRLTGYDNPPMGGLSDRQAPVWSTGSVRTGLEAMP